MNLNKMPLKRFKHHLAFEILLTGAATKAGLKLWLRANRSAAIYFTFSSMVEFQTAGQTRVTFEYVPLAGLGLPVSAR